MIRITSGELAIIRMLESQRALMLAMVAALTPHHIDPDCKECQVSLNTIQQLLNESARIAGSVLEVPYEVS